MGWIGTLESVTGGEVVQAPKMFSRRNRVYRASVAFPDGTLKTYAVKVKNFGAAVEEAYILTLLRAGGVNVPRVFWNDAEIIVLEYLDGVLLTDMLLAAREPARQDHWIEALARWFLSLHSFMRLGNRRCLCMPDLNLRNFIYADGRFFGCDFEEAVVDTPERDLGGICAHFFNNDPMFAEYKYDVAKKLIQCYLALAREASPDACLDLDLVNRCFVREMRTVMERRRTFGRGDVRITGTPD